MTATNVLIAAAWEAHDADPDDPNAQHLKAWVEQFEDTADMLGPDVKVVAYQVLRAISMVTGDSTVDLLDSMPVVADWLTR